MDLLASDGKQGDGPERLGTLAAATLKEVGSLKDVVAKWEERLPGATVLPISALEGINTPQVSYDTVFFVFSHGTATNSTSFYLLEAPLPIVLCKAQMFDLVIF